MRLSKRLLRLASSACLAGLLIPIAGVEFGLAAEQCKNRSCVTVTATKTATGFNVNVKLRPRGDPEFYNVRIPGHRQTEVDGPGNIVEINRAVSADWNGTVEVQACNTNTPLPSRCDSWRTFQAEMPKLGETLGNVGKAIEDVVEQAVDVPPPPPCPEGEMRIKGKCQIPPLKSGTSKDASGFIQMFPTCPSGKTYDQAKKACVANVPAAKMCSVDKPGAVYNKQQGDKVGELAANTRDVTLLEKSGANWFHVKWPGGQGWVYSGPGYENAISCS